MTDVNYKNLVTYHVSNNNDLTVGIKKIKISNPYGVFKFKNKNKIDTFVEKPIESHFISAGVYVLNTSILKLIKKNVHFDITQLVDLVIKKNYKINAFPIHENWIDIGTHENLNKFLK